VLAAAALVTVTVYVLVCDDTPAWTYTAIALAPTLSACAADCAPDTTELEATVIWAPESTVVAVIVTEFTPFATLTAYAIVSAANAGDKVPTLTTSEANVASAFLDISLVTVKE
jgi:hypothetical protein